MTYKKVETERSVYFCALYHKDCSVLTTSFWLTDKNVAYSTRKCMNAGVSPQCFACQNNEYFFIKKDEPLPTIAPYALSAETTNLEGDSIRSVLLFKFE